jgi:hypothetical protein
MFEAIYYTMKDSHFKSKCEAGMASYWTWHGKPVSSFISLPVSAWYKQGGLGKKSPIMLLGCTESRKGEI